MAGSPCRVPTRSLCAQLFEFRGGRPPEGAAAAKGGAAASADSSDSSGVGREVFLLVPWHAVSLSPCMHDVCC